MLERLEQCLDPAAEGVVVRERDAVDTEVEQRLDRHGRGLESERLRRRLAALGDAALEVEDEEVGAAGDLDQLGVDEGVGRVPPEHLRDAGAALVAGTSAHVFQGVEKNVLYDLGDFLDDYRAHRRLRNDHGLLFFVELEPDGPQRIEAVPLKLEYAYTRLAHGSEAEWIRQRFRRACSELGTDVLEEDGRLVVRPTHSTGGAYGPAG